PSDPHDEDWAEALLHENSSTHPAAPETDVPEPTVDAQNTDEPSDAIDADIPADAERPPVDEPAWPGDRNAQLGGDEAEPTEQSIVYPQRSEPARSGNEAFHLVDEPLQLDWRPPARRRSRWLLWTLLNLL